MFRINFQNSRDLQKGVGHVWMGIGMIFLTTLTVLSTQVEGRSGEGGASVGVPEEFKNTRDLNLNVSNNKPHGNIKLDGHGHGHGGGHGGGGVGGGKKKERIFLGDDSLLSFSYAGAGSGGKLSIGGGIYGGGQLGVGVGGYNGFGLGIPNPSFYSRPFSFYGGPGPILSGGVFGSLLGSSHGYGYGHGHGHGLGLGFNNNYGHGNSLGFGFPPGFQYKHHKHHFHHGHGFSHFNYNHHQQGGLISPFTAIY